MAEFCLKCWNELNGTNDKKSKYIISLGLDWCEGCGDWRHVIVCERKYLYRRIFRFCFPSYWRYRRMMKKK